MTVFSRRDLLSLMGGAALVPAIGVPPGHAATRYIVIGTGGTGGVFYPYGGGLAQLLSKKLPETQATAEVTGGSVDNVKLLGTGDAEIGFSTVDSAYDGFKGEEVYKDAGPQKIATLAVLYPSVLHVVASKASGIKTIADIKGKRASVGSAGSSTESIADRVLAAGGARSQDGRHARQSWRCGIGRRTEGRQGRCFLLDRRRADGRRQGSRLDQCQGRDLHQYRRPRRRARREISGRLPARDAEEGRL